MILLKKLNKVAVRRVINKYFRALVSLAVVSAAVFGLAALFGGARQALALGDVTLHSSAFSDSDPEDTHRASQWVVRDASAGVFDSGADIVNKTSITISSSYFTPGQTYWWKVRHQDNHYRWGAYSDEASFTYGSAPAPTPTATATATATPTPEPLPDDDDGDDEDDDGEEVICDPWSGTWDYDLCGDLVTMGVKVVKPDSSNSDLTCGGMRVTFLMNGGFVMFGSPLELVKNPHLRADLYLSTGGGYTRIARDIDYSRGWEFMPDPSAYRYKINYDFPLPDNDWYLSEGARVAVHLYYVYGSWSYDGSYGLGETFYSSPVDRGTVFYATGFSEPFGIKDGCDTPPFFTPTPLPLGINIAAISPKRGDCWQVGNTHQVLWSTDYTSQTAPRVEKVNVSLSKDGGRSFPHLLALSLGNFGAIEVNITDAYESSKAVIKVDGYSAQGQILASGQSGVFRIARDCSRGGFYEPGKLLPIANSLLFLGALLAALSPYLMALIASSPVLSRALEKLIAFGLVPLLTSITHPFSFFYLWKGRKRWGIVYDAVTKKPVVRAAVRIFSEPGGRLREARYTNERGEFGFIVPAGKYTLTASKPGFSFPSHLVKGRSDSGYEQVYYGEEIEVSSAQAEGKEPIMVSIPMDEAKMSTWDLAFTSFISFWQRFFAFIRVPFMLFGLGLTIHLLVTTKALIYWILLAVYLLLFLIEAKRMLSPKIYGIVVGSDGLPLALAVVRAIDSKGHLRATVVTGEDGKFNADLSPGVYQFSASRVGFLSAKTGVIKISKMADFGKVNLELVKLSQANKAV